MANNSGESATSNPPSELVKLQFDYAWKWFNFHADQRIKMFNYMLVVFGVFATAVVATFDKHLPFSASAALSLVAGLLAFVFVLLDKRNEYLVRLGEDVLVELEQRHIFGNLEEIDNRDSRRITFGILWRQEREDRDAGKGCWLNIRTGRHRFWLSAIAVAIGVLFCFASYLFWTYTPPASWILL